MICQAHIALNVVENRAVSINNYKDHIACHSKLKEKQSSAKSPAKTKTSKYFSIFSKARVLSQSSSSQSVSDEDEKNAREQDTTDQVELDQPVTSDTKCIELAIETLTAEEFEQLEKEREGNGLETFEMVTTEEFTGAYDIVSNLEISEEEMKLMKLEEALESEGKGVKEFGEQKLSQTLTQLCEKSAEKIKEFWATKGFKGKWNQLKALLDLKTKL